MTYLIRSVQLLVAHVPQGIPERADVFINGGKIAAIGNFPNKQADEVLDGQGGYLAPGFIDIDTTSDHYLSLFTDPGQEDFLSQGITSIIGGQCGASLAPLLAGNLDSIRKWADIRAMNVNWHSLKEFFAYLATQPLFINFGTLIGHSTIRRDLTSGVLRDLTEGELHSFAKILDESLSAGAFGMSTGLAYVHGRSASYKELNFFAQNLKKAKALYATHLRKSGPELPEGIDETIQLAKETGINTLITHLAPQREAQEEFEYALHEIESLKPEVNLHFSLAPFDESSVPLYKFLPQWAQSGKFEEMYAHLNSEHRERIYNDLPDIKGDEFVVGHAPGNEMLAGKTLKQLMTMFGAQNFKRTILQLMQTTHLRAVIHYRNLDIGLVHRALQSPRALVASHAPSLTQVKGLYKSRRSTHTFREFLRLAEKENIMPLEDAVRRITKDAAQKMGIAGRGEIREGNFADLVCFKNQEVRFVLINGRLAYRDGQVMAKPAGQILKHV